MPSLLKIKFVVFAALLACIMSVPAIAQDEPANASVSEEAETPSPSVTTALGEFSTEATYAYVVDVNTGEVLLNKNADEPMHPASMTKLMTAYMVFDALRRGALTLDTMLPVSEKAWRMGGSRMFVNYGTDVKVEDLIKGMIVESGNDACVVLAEALYGSEEAFAEEMNYMAKKLGLTTLHFKNATGLPNPEHVVSAKDLATLGQHIIEEFPEYFKYYSLKEFTYNNITQPNRNHLLSRDFGADGMKTGYTEMSGYGMVATAQQNGHRIIAVVNGLKSAKQRLAEAERVIKWGFREFELVNLIKKGDAIDTAQVWLGADETVPLVVRDDVQVTLPRQRSKRADIQVVANYSAPIQAPVQAGDVVGTLTIKRDGKDFKTVNLYAGQTVAAMPFTRRLVEVPRKIFAN